MGPAKPVLAIFLAASVLLFLASAHSALAAPPANDNLAGATQVTIPGGSGLSSVAEATTEAGEPVPSCGASAANSIWFKLQAATTDTATADTLLTNYDTLLAIYSGPATPSFGSLTPLACSDDYLGEAGSRVEFPVISGNWYYFQVTREAGGSADVAFRIGIIHNDDLADATAIATPQKSGQVGAGSVWMATNETNENWPSCETSVTASVWFAWTPATAGHATFDTSGSSMDTVLAVYTGSAFPLTEVGCNDDYISVGGPSQVSFLYSGGTTYYIQVREFCYGLPCAFGTAGSFVLNLTLDSTWIVNDAAATNDGACQMSPGNCTLREAINAANGEGYASLIILSTGQIYSLNVVDNGFNGLPLISTDITIEGNGSAIARDGAAPQFRLFQVSGTGILNLNEVTLTGGYAPDAAGFGGGAIRVDPGGTANLSVTTVSGNRSGNGSSSGLPGKPGGGIHAADATLTLTDSTVSGNAAGNGRDRTGLSGAGGAGGHGGGIYSGGTGTLTVNRSTIAGNTGGDGGSGPTSGGAGGSGGGLYIEAGITARITNSTIANNTGGDRTDTGTTGGSGGGIRTLSTNLELRNVTLSGNAVGSGGSAGTGGNLSTGAAIFATNTIISTPALGANCAGTAFNSISWPNQATDTSCSPGFTESHTVNLGPLANNGGPTQTMALTSGSSAIDAGDNGMCGSFPVSGVDQRGVVRPFDGDANGTVLCDMGAYEAPDIDADDDGVVDASDNCPGWPNPTQNTPDWFIPAGDSDCDNFTDAAEAFSGTNAAMHCASTSTRNDEASPDRWPSDFDDNQLVNIIDVSTFSSHYGSVGPNPPYDKRWDFNGDNRVNIIDVSKMSQTYGKNCA